MGMRGGERSDLVPCWAPDPIGGKNPSDQKDQNAEREQDKRPIFPDQRPHHLSALIESHPRPIPATICSLIVPRLTISRP